MADESMAYERLRNAIDALGGTLEHEKLGQPQGGAWVLRLGGYTLEIPSTQTERFPDLDRCYRPVEGVPFPDSYTQYTNDIDPVGVLRLLQRLVRTSPSMARTEASLPSATQRALEARLKERHAAATADLKRARYVPTRWIQMEAEFGTLAACQSLLTDQGEEVWVSQLTTLWDLERLHQSVEAIALEKDFSPLFTETERRIARERLLKFGYDVK